VEEGREMRRGRIHPGTEPGRERRVRGPASMANRRKSSPGRRGGEGENRTQAFFDSSPSAQRLEGNTWAKEEIRLDPI
jgi:hypothetical protein